MLENNKFILAFYHTPKNNFPTNVYIKENARKMFTENVTELSLLKAKLSGAQLRLDFYLTLNFKFPNSLF